MSLRQRQEIQEVLLVDSPGVTRFALHLRRINAASRRRWERRSLGELHAYVFGSSQEDDLAAAKIEYIGADLDAGLAKSPRLGVGVVHGQADMIEARFAKRRDVGIEQRIGINVAQELDLHPRRGAAKHERHVLGFETRDVCCLGEFPERLDFQPAPFGAIYSARLLHFLDGERIRMALDKIVRRLVRGGKVFRVSDAVYRTIFKPLIPIYERRVADGDAWPGSFADVSACIAQAVRPDNCPKKMNFFDPAVLTRALRHAGLDVKTAALYPYTGSFAPGRLDGRELAGAIARKA